MNQMIEKVRHIRRIQYLNSFNPIFAVLIAFLVSGLMVLLSGGSPIEAYIAIARGAFGSMSSIMSTIRFTLPLLLLAIAFTMCNKCGYFNIGQEGQMYASALTITWVQISFGNSLPVPILFLLMLVCGAVVGGLVSLLPAYLKLKFGVNEIVMGILLNYTILRLSDFLLQNTALGKPHANTSMSVFYIPSIPTPVLAVIACLIVIVYAFIEKKTIPGYRLRMVGSNPIFAQFSGLNKTKIVLVVAMLSGVLASLTSTGELVGIYKCFYYNYADGLGFSAMTAALIGKQSVVGMLFGALLLGALQSGAIGLSVSASASPEIVILVRGFVMLFGTISVLQYFMHERRKTKEIS
ncbi:ABC transporter permease [Clostridia bacterium]|nr:ABC transporter permease [Clostridia bacterium]